MSQVSLSRPLMISDDLRTRIIAAVAEGFSEQIRFTEDLVRFESLRGKEHAVQEFVAAEMKRRAWRVDQFPIDTAAIANHPGGSPVSSEHSTTPIVVGSHEPCFSDDGSMSVGRSLILQGHVDVVPTGPSRAWKFPPFEPHVDGDWLYGRGAGDMKAGHAAMFAAMDALARIGMQPAARVHVQSVVEEESTGNGAIMTLLRGYRADAVVIAEPTDAGLVRANTGIVWFQVHVEGRPVHARHAQIGQNAIEAAFKVISALHDVEAIWNERQDGRAWFPDDDHPIKLNVGQICGGDWASSVPAWCRLDCRIAIYPGERPKDMMQAIEAALADLAGKDAFFAGAAPRVTWNGFTTEGYILDESSAAVEVLGRAHYAVLGSPLKSKAVPCYLDARAYVLYGGMPALVYGPRAEQTHGYGERVSLTSLQQVTGTLALFIAEWCGLQAKR